MGGGGSAGSHYTEGHVHSRCLHPRSHLSADVALVSFLCSLQGLASSPQCDPILRSAVYSWPT